MRSPTCQWGESEMLRLAALPLAVDDAEVDFDRLADGRVSVGRHLHKQHILQNSQLSGTYGNWTHVPAETQYAPAGSYLCPLMLPFPRFAAHLKVKTKKQLY